MLSMWGKIMILMNRLRLHGLYGLYGPRCPLSPERPLNLITHSLTWYTINEFTRYTYKVHMMMSSNGSIFRVIGPLCGEFTGDRWIPLTKAVDTELWSFLWSVPWINGRVNNHEADDLRRHRAHYDVIVMSKLILWARHVLWNPSGCCCDCWAH